MQHWAGCLPMKPFVPGPYEESGKWGEKKLFVGIIVKNYHLFCFCICVLLEAACVVKA